MPIAAAEIEKYRQYCPESKTDADITALVAEKNGEEAEIQRVISTWWEQALAGTLSAADNEPETTTPYSPQAVDTVRTQRAVGEAVEHCCRSPPHRASVPSAPFFGPTVDSRRRRANRSAPTASRATQTSSLSHPRGTASGT